MVIKNEVFPGTDLLLLGVDGGGTRWRARLATLGGTTLADAGAGPANIRPGLDKSLAAVFEASAQCLTQAGLTPRASRRIALDGALRLAGAAAGRSSGHARFPGLERG
jgi:glucosamine kinase